MGEHLVRLCVHCPQPKLEQTLLGLYDARCALCGQVFSSPEIVAYRLTVILARLRELESGKGS